MVLLAQLSDALQVPEVYLLNLARRASHEYRSYQVPKRAGGTRTIHHPSKVLKSVQRWLVANVINAWPVHDAAAAYRSGANIFSHGARHAPYRFLLRLDLVSFFPSITEADIETYVVNNSAWPLGWLSDDRLLFRAFVTLNGRLTIGAPSSPALSNAICFELDTKLYDLAASRDVVYTRYADDLFFSTNQRDVLREFPNLAGGILAGLSVPVGLQLNTSKTQHRSRAQRRVVTGIVLAPDGRPLLGRAMKRRIRALVHRFESLDNEERQSLAGLIAYAIGIEPDFLNRLVLKYGQAVVTQARSIKLRT